MIKSRYGKFEQLKRIDLFGKRVNLRFQNNDFFKTYCGAFATIAMFFTLIVIFGLKTIDIMNGKIDKLSYMIKNYDLNAIKNSNTKKAIEEIVFAIGLEEKYLDETYLKFDIGIQKTGEQFIPSNSSYECTDYVLQGLSSRFINEIPKQMKIFCFNISSLKFEEGFNPIFTLRECRNETKGCRGKNVRDKLLSEFSVWSFLLTDETDFTNPITSLKHNFRAAEVSVSNSYKTNSVSSLRELEIAIKKGLFLSKWQKFNTYQYLRSTQHILKLHSHDSDDNVLLHKKVRLDRSTIVVINKEFKTILDLLAYIGGISKGIGILLLMLVLPVREVLFYRKLINHMFSVCVDEKQIQIALGMKIMENNSEEDEEVPLNQKQNLTEKNQKKVEFERNKNKKKTKRLKSQLHKFKKMIKNENDNKKNKGLIDVMANGALTKEKIMENLRAAFEKDQGGGTPKNFSSLIGIGMKKSDPDKPDVLIKDPKDCFIGGEMMSLESREKLAFEKKDVKNMLSNWIGRARKRLNIKKIEEVMSPSGIFEEQTPQFANDVEKIISKNYIF